MHPVQYNQVYYVEAPEGLRTNLVAIKPEIFEDRIEWQDTSPTRGGAVWRLGKIDTQFQKGNTKDNTLPDEIEFTTKDGAHFKLIKLTLDIYNSRVKSHVANPPNFTSDSALQEYFKNTDFENW